MLTFVGIDNWEDFWSETDLWKFSIFPGIGNLFPRWIEATEENDLFTSNCSFDETRIEIFDTIAREFLKFNKHKPIYTCSVICWAAAVRAIFVYAEEEN